MGVYVIGDNDRLYHTVSLFLPRLVCRSGFMELKYVVTAGVLSVLDTAHNNLTIPKKRISLQIALPSLNFKPIKPKFLSNM